MAGAGRLAELGRSVRQRFAAQCPAGPVVVAISGGADSAVCAWAAKQISPEVRAVFVDHGFVESAALERAARAVAAAVDCPLAVVSVEVEDGASLEAQARIVRLAALESALGAGESLLTGHTADDQAETVLGNILRGAGATGLSGIPARRGRWARPLLGVTRSETRELAGLLGLPFRDDPSNSARDVRRNVLRSEVLPDLEARFNPELRAALVRTARLVASDDEELAAAAARVPLRISDGTARLAAPLLATLPVPVAARAIRVGLRAVHPPYPGTEADVAAALSVARGDAAGQALTGGYVAERRGPWLTLRRADSAPDTWPEVAWQVPGGITAAGFRMDAWMEDRPPSPWPLGSATTVLDADAVGDEIVARPVREGDRIPIKGGSKPVREALAEAAVPVPLRQAWPVLLSQGRLVWLAGVRAAPWARPQPGSKRFLWLAMATEDW